MEKKEKCLGKFNWKSVTWKYTKKRNHTRRINIKVSPFFQWLNCNSFDIFLFYSQLSPFIILQEPLLQLLCCYSSMRLIDRNFLPLTIVEKEKFKWDFFGFCWFLWKCPQFLFCVVIIYLHFFLCRGTFAFCVNCFCSWHFLNSVVKRFLCLILCFYCNESIGMTGSIKCYFYLVK